LGLKETLKSRHESIPRESKFFKKSVEYLGLIVSQGGLRTSPEKVKVIKEFPPPKTLFDLRSFLGLSSYYRCFIKNFAVISRPLTNILKGEKKEFPPPKTLFDLRSFLGLASYYRCFIKNFAAISRPLTNIPKGENGKNSIYQSRKVDINMNKEQRETLDRLREILASEDVLLSYPDFKRPFDLGAVLSQDGRPITMISRALRDSEKNYATNERELHCLGMDKPPELFIRSKGLADPYRPPATYICRLGQKS